MAVYNAAPITERAVYTVRHARSGFIYVFIPIDTVIQ